MKKIRTLVILVLLTALLAVPVAAAAGKATITSPNVTAAQGESFTLTVNLSDADKIKIGTALLIYDTAAFELQGGKCLVEGTAVAQVVKDKNVGTFMLMDAKKVSGDIFTFDMKVKENASAGDYNIQLKVSIGVDSGEYIEAVGTVVTVTETSSGTTPPAPTEEKTPDSTTGSASEPVDSQPADTQQTPDVTTPEGTEEKEPDATIQNNTDGTENNAADQADKNQPGAQQGAQDAPQAGFPWWIVIVLAAAAAVVVAVVVIRKKKAA